MLGGLDRPTDGKVIIDGQTRYIVNNMNSEMPRSYNRDTNNMLYTWHAATAESGKRYASPTYEASDSICPAGWTMPMGGDKDGAKSWKGLLSGSYELSDSDSAKVRQSPLSI